MGRSSRLGAALGLLAAAALAGAVAAAPAEAPMPEQLEMHVAMAPTAFASDGRTHLLYELRLTSFRKGAPDLSIQRIEILDADTGAVLASFAGPELQGILTPVGAARDAASIPPGGSVVAFLAIDLPPGKAAPARLRHRVVLADSDTSGAVVGTKTTVLHVLGPPVQAGRWLASDGPDNAPDNHHRRGIFVTEGAAATVSRRFATDWIGAGPPTGDPRDRASYYPYDKDLLAVADARVAFVLDGLPENTPGHGRDFHPAVPITMATVGGNRVVLDLGGGQYAHYMHVKPGSLKVKAGDRVRRGQVIGRIGASGDAREPHLHFEVTTSPEPLAGEGLPYLIDAYRVVGGERTTAVRRSLPMNKQVVEFGR